MHFFLRSMLKTCPKGKLSKHTVLSTGNKLQRIKYIVKIFNMFDINKDHRHSHSSTKQSPNMPPIYILTSQQFKMSIYHNDIHQSNQIHYFPYIQGCRN